MLKDVGVVGQNLYPSRLVNPRQSHLIEKAADNNESENKWKADNAGNELASSQCAGEYPQTEKQPPTDGNVSVAADNWIRIKQGVFLDEWIKQNVVFILI